MKQFFRNLTDLIYVSFLWFFISLLGLLITTGAATTAMFRVTFQIFRKEEPTNVTRLFFRSFKESIQESTLVWFLILLVAVPLFFLMQEAFKTNNSILILISFVILIELVMFVIYVFPIISYFKNENFWTLIRNTLYLSHTNLWLNIKLFGSFALLMLLVFFVSSFFLILVAVVYGVLVTFHLRPKFEQIKEELVKNNTKISEDLITWNIWILKTLMIKIQWR